MKKLITILFVTLSLSVLGQQPMMSEMVPEMTELWDPEVPIISPGETTSDAPSDAIVLLGKDKGLGDEWIDAEGSSPKWLYEDGVTTVAARTGTIQTKRQFGDCQLHIEWRSPVDVIGESQGRGNSGIFLQGLYEIQILDNFNNRTYKNGQAGSIYKQYAPLVNACKAPGEWQSYDIIYTAPRFNDDGTYFTNPRVTLIHNGVLVQNNVEVRGPTQYIGIPEYFIEAHGNGPIILQDHGNPVSYRNIWIREL